MFCAGCFELGVKFYGIFVCMSISRRSKLNLQTKTAYNVKNSKASEIAFMSDDKTKKNSYCTIKLCNGSEKREIFRLQESPTAPCFSFMAHFVFLLFHTENLSCNPKIASSQHQHLAEVLILFNMKTEKSNFTPAIRFGLLFYISPARLRPFSLVSECYLIEDEMVQRVIGMWVRAQEKSSSPCNKINAERGFYIVIERFSFSSRLYFSSMMILQHFESATVESFRCRKLRLRNSFFFIHETLFTIIPF